MKDDFPSSIGKQTTNFSDAQQKIQFLPKIYNTKSNEIFCSGSPTFHPPLPTVHLQVLIKFNGNGEDDHDNDNDDNDDENKVAGNDDNKGFLFLSTYVCTNISLFGVFI